MTIVYLMDSNAIFIGTKDINLDQGRPSNSVLTSPPSYNSSTEFVTWTGSAWLKRPMSEYPLPTPIIPQTYSIPTFLIRQRAEKLGIWDDLSAYLVQYPALMLKTLTLQAGIDPKDPDLIKGFTDLSMPQSVQDYLLSDPSLGV